MDDIVNRSVKPIPWTEGEKIPWDEPAFSQRMLREHLSQEHDAASRRFEVIDLHVDWIHKFILKEKPARLLDLGCGPGFYVSRLARLGHTCTGVDFSPASIAYAQEQEAQNPTGSRFIHADVRKYDYGSGYDLVMMIYGEFNTFLKPAARAILIKAHKALKNDGRLLIELNSYACLHRFGLTPSAWHTSQGGLFSDKPYLFLEESFWNPEVQAATRRMYMIDSASGEVEQFADNHQAYTEDDLRAIIVDCGFSKVDFFQSWPGQVDEKNDTLLMVCEK